VLENPGPTKPQRMPESPARRRSDVPLSEGETSHLLSSFSPVSNNNIPPTSTHDSLRVTPLNNTPLLSTTTSGNRLATPPHRLLLETSFTCTPTASPEPPLDLRRHAHIHSPAITWELLSALEEQLLLGVREAGRGAGDRGENWLAGVAPLASPETLSEASSVVSRASLLLREGRGGSAVLPPLQQSPALNQRHPTTRLGAGYGFFVETPPLSDRRLAIPAPEKLPESSDDEEISPRSSTPSSYITIETIIPTPVDRKSNETTSSNHIISVPLDVKDDTLSVLKPFSQCTTVSLKTVQSSKNVESRSSVDKKYVEESEIGGTLKCIETVDKEVKAVGCGKNGNGDCTDEEQILLPNENKCLKSVESPESDPSHSSSSGSQRIKFDLTASQMSRDSGFGERLNGYETLCVNTAELGYPSGAFGGHQQEYGRGQVSLVHHYMYSGMSPQLSPSSPGNTDSFTSPLTSDPPSSKPASLLPTPVDIPQMSTVSCPQTSISTQCAHPLYRATPLLHDLSKVSKPSCGMGYISHRAESSV
ncbi:hypothetical protein SK128_003866, partial [Halocaridina rubra]